MRAPFFRHAALCAASLVAGPAVAITDLAQTYGGCVTTTTAQTIAVGPTTYQATVSSATAGQRIVLASGTYDDGLDLFNLNASAGNCIVIEGPPDRSAVFTALPGNGLRNVVQIRNSSFVVLRNIEIDGTGTDDCDGVKGENTIAGPHGAAWSHHITLENLHIHDFDGTQQQVGISTKGPAWNWVVRNALLERIGTGVYFGNSDGRQHFVNGLIEFNVILDSVGYNMQIKHQTGEPRRIGAGFETLPTTGRTVIRHNVFNKVTNDGADGPRPALLVGAFPLTGDGSNDDYVVSGNFFFQTPGGEALFQAEGNVIFFSNVLYNSVGPGIFIQRQLQSPPVPNGEVRRIRIFQNTVLATDTGIFVSSNVNGAFTQLVRGNAVFANGTPIDGGTQSDNVTDTFGNAGLHVTNPSGLVTGTMNRMNLYPLAGGLTGAAIDATPLAGYVDSDRDFNDVARDGTVRGAYGGTGANPGWQLALSIKQLAPGPADVVFADGFE